MYKVILLLVVIFVTKQDAARILAVFPAPSISHQVTFRPLTHELAKRGHEVVIVTPDPAFPKDKRPDNLTEIDIHDSYKLWREKVLQGINGDMKSQIKFLFELSMEVFEMQMNFEEVQQIIKKNTEPFDLLIIEACMLPALGFSHIYKVPVIQISSFLPFYSNINTIGAVDHPHLYPVMSTQKLDNLSTIEKINLYYDHFVIQNVVKNAELDMDKVIKRVFGSDTPPLSKLYNNVDMLFLNTFPIWDSNRPVPPSVQYLGGIHVKPVKQLPEDLKKYLDSSKHGVIYISFGTNVDPSTLPPEKIQVLLNVLSGLPYDVIWKWNQDVLPGKSENIKISKWLPQSDLLRHPKLKLFITQAGLQSTDEAIVAGVPLLAIPILGDQWYNAAMYERHKIGVKIEMENLSERTLKEALHVLTVDDTYRQNIIRFRSVIYDQPQTPLERAVWWTEHVLRHGGARHLRSPAANLPWTVYYEVELVAYALLVVTSAISVFVYLVLKVRRLIVSKMNANIKLKYS